MSKIKVVFFDGDGTLWYPAKTMRTRVPHWVYDDPLIADPIKEFVVTPGTAEALEELGRRGIKRVVLSTSPLAVEEAIMSRISALQHVNIHHLLDEVHVAPAYPEGKTERLVELIAQYGVNPSEALMVGDTYIWDYVAAHNAGIRALFIKSDYQMPGLDEVPATDAITTLLDLLEIINRD